MPRSEAAEDPRRRLSLHDERQPLLSNHDETLALATTGFEDLEDLGDVKDAQRDAWTRRTLLIAYVSLFFMAICVSLEGQTVVSLSAYATSAFKKHSMLSTILAIQGVINAVIKAPMAKFAAAFGRLEAYVCCIIIYVLGYIQMAAARNVQTYASAQIFYATGSTSMQILQQIFIADTTDLLNRALFTRLPDIPYLFTVWIGPWLADQILRKSSWRWGYGIWAILLPLTSSPLIMALVYHRRRVKKLGLPETSDAIDADRPTLLQRLWYNLDVPGFILFSTGLTLILVPISLAGIAKNGWKNPGIIATVISGIVCLAAFLRWETHDNLAPSPLIPLRLLKDRTVLAGCCLAFWYFMAFYFSVQPYLFSYLQVVHYMPVVTAGRITQTFGFTATVSAVTISLFIRRTRRYRRFVILGCLIYVSGLVSMLLYRTEFSSTASILASQIIIGVGGGIVNVSVQVGIQASSEPADVATATAIFLTALEMGGAVGSAISGAVWTYTLPAKLRHYLPPESKGDADKIFKELAKAISYPANSATRLAINQSYQETMDILMFLAVCVGLVIIPMAIMMKSVRL